MLEPRPSLPLLLMMMLLLLLLLRPMLLMLLLLLLLLMMLLLSMWRLLLLVLLMMLLLKFMLSLTSKWSTQACVPQKDHLYARGRSRCSGAQSLALGEGARGARVPRTRARS